MPSSEAARDSETMSLSRLFSSSKSHVLNLLKSSQPVRLVTGNEAADLDSLSSSILYSLYSPQPSPSPLLSIPRVDLNLRPEILWLLKEHGVSPQDLLCMDDLPSEVSSHLELYLVDHNSPSKALRALSKNWEVKGIIDHHEDTGGFTDADPRVIEVCGSCVSLVTNTFKKAIQDTKTFETAEAAARFGLATIAIDTGGLQRRVTPHDLEAVGVLQQVLKRSGREEIDLRQFADQLQEMKSHIDGMDVRDLLRKDYKEWEIKGVEGAVMLGVSSVPASLDTILSLHSAKEVADATHKWMNEKNLHIAVIMTSFTLEDGSFHREIVAWGKSAHGKNFIADFAPGEKWAGMQLSDWAHETGGGGFEGFAGIHGPKVYRQGNLEWSRKQVAPALIEGIQAMLGGRRD